MESVAVNTITPGAVDGIMSQHLLTKGMFPLVLDMERSQGVYLYDEVSGNRFIDFFSFFASSPLGMNHPKLSTNEDFLHRLRLAAINKVTNSDILTSYIARFVQTFSRVGIPGYLPHAFFVSGGALGVENALKAAFDWKVRKNFRKGYRYEKGFKVLHFEEAFHGRTGYTLSLTNTENPAKTMYYPKFDWPRVVNPKIRFPLNDKNLQAVKHQEDLALSQAKMHFQQNKDDIACVIIEPVQGEGGDNHFRPEFLQRLKDLTHENDALFILDEVQSGVGMTGAFWAHQALDVRPDIIAFGKKTQVCGILAGPKIDEVEENVFTVPNRLNSTWGGNLVDMVRFDRILEIYEEDNLVEQAAKKGTYLQGQLHQIAEENPSVSNVRGLGLMCALDLPDPATRDRVLTHAYEQGVIILGCGHRTVRFRPPLIITESELDQGLDLLKKAIRAL